MKKVYADCPCDECKERARFNLVGDMTDLEKYLYSTLQAIARMRGTDPHAALMARKAIEEQRIQGLKGSGHAE
jgi:hypothetical protein